MSLREFHDLLGIRNTILIILSCWQLVQFAPSRIATSRTGVLVPMFASFHLFGSFQSVTLAESIAVMFVHFIDIDTCNPCRDEQRLVQGQTRPDESASPPASALPLGSSFMDIVK